MNEDKDVEEVLMKDLTEPLIPHEEPQDFNRTEQAIGGSAIQASQSGVDKVVDVARVGDPKIGSSPGMLYRKIDRETILPSSKIEQKKEIMLRGNTKSKSCWSWLCPGFKGKKVDNNLYSLVCPKVWIRKTL